MTDLENDKSGYQPPEIMKSNAVNESFNYSIAGDEEDSMVSHREAPRVEPPVPQVVQPALPVQQQPQIVIQQVPQQAAGIQIVHAQPG